MADGSLKTLRDALAPIIQTATGLPVHAFVPDSLVMPAAVLEPDQIDYLQVFRSTNADYTCRLLVLMGRANEIGLQEQLDNYISPDGTASIPAAILADETLGGVVNYCVPTQLINYGRFDVAGVPGGVIGAVILLDINA